MLYTTTPISKNIDDKVVVTSMHLADPGREEGDLNAILGV